MRRLRRGVLLVLALLVAASTGFYIWANATPDPMPQTLAALETDSSVVVSTQRWLHFRPTAEDPRAGLILYPGGRVDPRAYPPAARSIAAAGYHVFILPMPLNLGVLAPDRAGRVVAEYPDIDKWVIGGHSLGGAMAARYVLQNPELIDGLGLWAAYPAQNDDLSDYTHLQVTSVYGTRDGLASLQEIEASRANLPPQTVFVPIEGGNHAQFGWYGPQRGDLEASIPRAEQQSALIQATIALMERTVDGS